jgi:foldase protein PrsA
MQRIVLHAFPPIQRLRRPLVGSLYLMGLLLNALPAPAQEMEGTVIATVNGEGITHGQFFSRLQRLRGQDFISSVNPVVVRGETAGVLVMSSLINERLIIQWATKTKQMPPDQDINTDLENIKRQPSVVQGLANGELTDDSLRHDLRIQRARYNISTTGVTATAPEVEAYYKSHLANYTIAERWTLAAIRVARQENIAKVQAELKANKPFGEIAKTYSEDASTKDKGGEMGAIAANNPVLPEPLRTAIKALKEGEVSAPIKIDYDLTPGKPKTPNWWFVRLVKRESGRVIPFAEVKEQVERAATLERAGGYQAGDKKIGDFRKQSVIRITIPGYKALANEPKTP